MTPPPGKRLERLVAAMHHAESTGAVVTWNDEIAGRQFDVTVRFKFGLHSYLTVIECKDYSSKVSVEKIDAFVTKTRDVNANKAVFISSHGFQSGCFPVAERHGIQLLILSETTDTSIPELVERITPGLNIYDVKFRASSSNDHIKFEDWGGRLAYLMNHSRLVSTERERTPNQFVYEWQMTQPPINLDTVTSVELPLPPASRLCEPHGQEVRVAAMLFTCSFVNLAIPKQPMPDNHVLRGARTRIELRDASGKVHHSARLGDLPLGYDSPVQPGQFYELPSMFSRYYCEKIEDDLVTWTLVESYQHGNLVQATFTQKIKYSSTYVQVTDSAVLQRLNEMLARLKAKK
ncbi:restriction endonuclease [Methylibium sp.]|uniref:restriction endonuclease n=1 Tax=Methylibium sp. TaxID=2067992 RepID=UPI003BA9DB64